MMPALFLGHGNPMNAISDNPYSRAWAAIGKTLPRPAAILAISAHWYLPSTAVTDGEWPRTIHDFGGFPDELFQVQYPAPGSPQLARKIVKELDPLAVHLDATWGLDHGTWSVLRHVFPVADIPVIQLSIDKTKPPDFHYEIGRQLAALRNDGVLIVGSGNLVHNLGEYIWDENDVEPFDWAVRFENRARALLLAGEDKTLIDYGKLGPDAALSIPSPDHYLPLLYILGTRQANDKVSFPVEGFDGGSMSMLSMQLG